MGWKRNLFPPNLENQTGLRRFGCEFIYCQILKSTLFKKMRKNKNTTLPEILKTTNFLEKTSNREFQRNKTEATKYEKI